MPVAVAQTQLATQQLIESVGRRFSTPYFRTCQPNQLLNAPLSLCLVACMRLSPSETVF